MKLRTFFSSLRFRLILMVLAVLIPAAGLLFYMSHHSRHLAEKEVIRSASRLSKLTAEVCRKQIEEVEHTLFTLAQMPELFFDHPAEGKNILKRLMEKNKNIANLGVIAPDASFVCSALDHDPSLRAIDRSYFEQAMKTKRFSIGEYQVGYITKIRSLNFGQPVLDPNGNVKGVFFAALRLDWLVELFNIVNLPNEAVLNVVDRNGTILAGYPNLEIWAGKNIQDASVLEKFRSNNFPPIERTSLDGVSRIFSFSPIFYPDNGPALYVGIGIDKKAALAEAVTAYNRSLILLAFFIFFVLFLTAWIGELLIEKQFKKLTNAAEELGKGNYKFRFGPPYYRGEIGSLGKTFDKMADSLEQRDRELRISNQRLEKAFKDLQSAQDKMLEQERIRSLGQMASGIAHDFNNSLTVMLGFSEVLILHPELLDDKPKVLHHLKGINTAAKDAAGIVKRLKEFYRIQVEEESVAFSLNSIVEQTVHLTQPHWKDDALFHGHSIVVDLNFKQDLPHLMGNEAETRTAITNLIFNAIDAMPEGGKLTLTTDENHNRILFSISDTGKGMTDEVKKHCLDPFFTTKGKKGTGMGLPMVHLMMQRLKGSIEISTEPNKGTTITLYFPKAFNHKTVETKPEARTDLKPLDILLVEDEDAVSNVILEYLAKDGHRTESVKDVDAALEVMKTHYFNLIISDGGLPGVTGQRFASILKKRYPNLPVILLTGYADYLSTTNENIKEADLILSKPVTINTLREALFKVTRCTAG